MKKAEKNTKNKLDKTSRVIDLLRGRTPIMENKILEIFYFLVIVGFWMFIVWKISIWSLSIPSISNLWDIIKHGHSP